MGVTASFTNVATGFTVQFTGLIDGRAAANSWDFGDGITATNEQYTSHAWASPGDYRVSLWAYNESQPGGISATVTVHVIVPPVHYVAADSVNPVAPYVSWATAATTIQDAVDAATVPGALVLVTNGTYATGGRAVANTTNRVLVDKLLEVRSVNGPRSLALVTVSASTPPRAGARLATRSMKGTVVRNTVSVLAPVFPAAPPPWR